MNSCHTGAASVPPSPGSGSIAWPGPPTLPTHTAVVTLHV